MGTPPTPTRVLRFIETRVLPRGWIDLFRQIVLFVGALLLYDLVRGVVDSDNPYKPFGDAMRIIDLERTLHVFIEPSVQAWAMNKHWLINGADWIYLNGHFFVTFAVLAFIYARRNSSFYFVRNMFMIAMGLALIGYWLYPTAPPRLMPEWGFTDAISNFVTGGTGSVDFGPSKAFLNFYAAVPSMHVCFAVMIGGSMSRLTSWRPGKILWALYPLLITFVVVATANHFLTDVFLGALTAGVSALLAQRLLARARPDAWAFVRARPPRPRRNGGAARRARAPRTGPTAQEMMRNRLIESRLTPNAISLTGFTLNLAAAALIVDRLFFLAGLAFIVGSIMDTLDGRYSRMSGKGSVFGAFLDSTLDRLEEGIVLIAVGAYFAARHNQVAAAATVAAVLGSLMVSYTRARAEALGVECKVGLATRPVRVVILSIGLVFARGASLGHFELLAPAVYVLAGLTVFTTLQRIFHVRRQLKRMAQAPV
jgi:CDP-diacylglycerol--glycerol-3-phosphate 3-phosphatidyltransferase